MHVEMAEGTIAPLQTHTPVELSAGGFANAQKAMGPLKCHLCEFAFAGRQGLSSRLALVNQ